MVHIVPFGFITAKNFYFIWFSNLSILNVLDEDYSRKSSYVLHLVPTFLLWICKTKLKFPKVISEAVNRGRPDNTMAIRNMTKVQSMIYKTLHRKLKIDQHEPIKTWD